MRPEAVMFGVSCNDIVINGGSESLWGLMVKILSSRRGKSVRMTLWRTGKEDKASMSVDGSIDRCDSSRTSRFCHRRVCGSRAKLSSAPVVYFIFRKS